jgi:hypothetical protein
MSTSVLDCTTLVPTIPYSPAFHPCWGLRAFPSTLSFAAGPSTPIPPNTTCNTGWPSTVITGTLARTGPCEFSWGYSSGSFGIFFAWTVASYPVVCTVNQATLYPSWSLNNIVASPAPSGSCSQDPTTGIVTLTFSGTISDGFCTCPVTVSYSG